METREEQIRELLGNVERLLQKKPFFRGGTMGTGNPMDGKGVNTLKTQRARLPKIERSIVTQERFLKELDPMCHDVIFDENVPSICVKGADGDTYEVKFQKCGLPIQERIREKQTLTMCGNETVFTLLGSEHTEQDNINFAAIKEEWQTRNMDGMRTKAVYTQLGLGDCGLLFYYDHNREVKCRLLSFDDGYVIITHKDENGDPLLDCVYYADENGVECVDCYDDKYMYRLRQRPVTKSRGMDAEWIMDSPRRHGFSESPLITKRGDVGWNKVQSLIDDYENLYNIFIVIQRRHGWGILYIRGRINDKLKKIAGSIVLQDTSVDGTGTAEFKAPPSPNGIIETLKTLFNQIQIGSSCTFILPEDVHSSGDISALALMQTQSLDIEGGTQRITEWQNFMNKMKRLFVEGIAKEHAQKGINKNAVTEYAKLRIAARMKLWRPFSEPEYNQMLATMKGAGILSAKTAIEKNTISTPDEQMRIDREKKEEQAIEVARTESETQSNKSAKGNTGSDETEVNQNKTEV